MGCLMLLLAGFFGDDGLEHLVVFFFCSANAMTADKMVEITTHLKMSFLSLKGALDDQILRQIANIIFIAWTLLVHSLSKLESGR